MPSQAKPQIVFKSIKTQLNKVDFKKLDDNSVNYNVVVKNRIVIKKIDESGFELQASRKLSFKPKGAFEVLVQFDLDCKFDDKSKKHYNGDIEEIEKFINKRKVSIFNSTEAGNFMSMIIGQLTLVDSKRSILIAPFISEKELV